MKIPDYSPSLSMVLSCLLQYLCSYDPSCVVLLRSLIRRCWIVNRRTVSLRMDHENQHIRSLENVLIHRIHHQIRHHDARNYDRILDALVEHVRGTVS